MREAQCLSGRWERKRNGENIYAANANVAQRKVATPTTRVAGRAIVKEAALTPVAFARCAETRLSVWGDTQACRQRLWALTALASSASLTLDEGPDVCDVPDVVALDVVTTVDMPLVVEVPVPLPVVVVLASEEVAVVAPVVVRTVEGNEDVLVETPLVVTAVEVASELVAVVPVCVVSGDCDASATEATEAAADSLERQERMRRSELYELGRGSEHEWQPDAKQRTLSGARRVAEVGEECLRNCSLGRAWDAVIREAPGIDTKAGKQSARCSRLLRSGLGTPVPATLLAQGRAHGDSRVVGSAEGACAAEAGDVVCGRAIAA